VHAGGRIKTHTSYLLPSHLDELLLFVDRVARLIGPRPAADGEQGGDAKVLLFPCLPNMCFDL